MQEYFKGRDFPSNMPAIWTQQWGNLLQHPRAGPAIVVGEHFGQTKRGQEGNRGTY